MSLYYLTILLSLYVAAADTVLRAAGELAYAETECQWKVNIILTELLTVCRLFLD